LIACAVLFVPNQLRTLNQLATIGLVSILTVAVVLVVCVLEVITDRNQDIALGSGETEATSVDFFAVSSAVSGFVFAFSGQKIYLGSRMPIYNIIF